MVAAAASMSGGSSDCRQSGATLLLTCDLTCMWRSGIGQTLEALLTYVPTMMLLLCGEKYGFSVALLDGRLAVRRDSISSRVFIIVKIFYCFSKFTSFFFPPQTSGFNSQHDMSE